MNRACGCNIDDACTCPMGVKHPHRANILSEASRLVKDDRAAQHGSFARNCADASTIARALGVNIRQNDIPVVLLALKLARMHQNAAAVDNYVDAAGYLQLLAEVRGVEVKSPAAS